MKTIEYKVSFERMISRLTALFAYLESDEYGNVSLHKATDSLSGCWGKVVQNIKLPENVSLTVDGVTILEEKKTYSFRTIIDYYYKYKDNLDSSDKFIGFIEDSIGKTKVPESVKGDATPDYVYLSTVKGLYDRLVKMDKQCTFYNENKERFGKDKHLCCICEQYEALGGKNFKDYIGSLTSMAEEVAERYMGYAEEWMTLDFDIDLTSTYQDFGIMTPYAPIWLPYKKYKEGDKVEYDGDLYVCTEDNNGKWDEDYLKVVFDDSKFEKIEPMFVDMYTLNENGTNYTRKRISSKGEIWNDGEALRHIAQNRDIGREVLNYDIELPFPLKNSGTTDSKLPDLRRFATYYNDDGVAERPGSGVDWLFYYRVGNVVNIRTINDSLGNVVKMSDMETASNDKNDLAAYGDVIVGITTDSEKPNTIKFRYKIGVHLNAEGNPTIVTDDNGNELIKWNKFVLDNQNVKNTGIEYVEEYNYEEGGDLDKLIRNSFRIDGISQTFSFNNYVNGEYDKKIPSVKFEFITINNTFSYDKTIAHQDVNIVSILSDFEIFRNDFDEFTNYDLFREEYFNGITYKPTKKIDVHIERGSTSAFDKHIAFGSVKTLDDMIDYQNHSFFRMNES